MNVFVFGSNLRGIHGAGSAKAALKYGAVRGVGVGRTGGAYAIPTKRTPYQTLPLASIGEHVSDFVVHAIANPQDTFDVVEIGCGLAGFTPEQIAPLFRGAPANVNLPARFKAVLERE